MRKSIKGFWVELELERKKTWFFFGALTKTYPSAWEVYFVLLPTIAIRLYVQDMRF